MWVWAGEANAEHSLSRCDKCYHVFANEVKVTFTWDMSVRSDYC